jgi:hypothetical protein
LGLCRGHDLKRELVRDSRMSSYAPA